MSKTFEIRLVYSLTHTNDEKVVIDEIVKDWKILDNKEFMIKYNFSYKKTCTSCGNLIFNTAFISGCNNCHNSFVE